MSSAVAHALPPSILALFAPRPPTDFKPPIEKRKMLNYTTIAQFVDQFEDPSKTPAPTVGETLEEKRAKTRKLKQAAAKEKVEAAAEGFDPANDAKIKGDPYKTLFVARIRRRRSPSGGGGVVGAPRSVSWARAWDALAAAAAAAAQA